jgi:hypothetical protein
VQQIGVGHDVMVVRSNLFDQLHLCVLCVLGASCLAQAPC